MNVLITGGAGFIGYHLARHHLVRGDSVVIVDNLSLTSGKKDQELQELAASPDLIYFQRDLTRLLLLPEDLPSLDIVYHLAAINGTRLFYEIPYQVARSNLLVTLNLLDWLEVKPPSELVYVSTSEVYAGAESVGLLPIPTNENVDVVFPQPTHVRYSYGTSKFMGEFLCFQFGRLFQVPTTVVRYHNIYGPRMGKEHVIPQMLDRIVKEENPLRVYGARETRAFCYVEDAVRATRLVATTTACDGETIHIGNPAEEVQIRDLAGLMVRQCGRDLTMKECEGRSGSVSRRCPDISKLQRLTGFAPEVSLKEGLARTRDWYLSRALN